MHRQQHRYRRPQFYLKKERDAPASDHNICKRTQQLLSTITANKTHLSGRLSVTSIKLVLTILPLFVVLRSLILASEVKQSSKGSQRESQQTVEFKLVELSVLVRSDSNIKENEDQESKQKEQGLSQCS